MFALNLNASYFAIGNPLKWLDRRCNRYCHQQLVELNHRQVLVRWTERAQRQLKQSEQALVIEMQLYFSCVVQKRVLFHHRSDLAATRVNKHLGILFRAVSSSACDPVKFARDHPEDKDLSLGVAMKMLPKRVDIDFLQGQWQGQFSQI